MKIAISQSQNILGDLKGNAKHICKTIKQVQNQADLLMFPEGGLFAYPPKDFLFRKDFFKIQESYLKKIQQVISKKLKVLLPSFVCSSGKLYNGVFLLEPNKAPLFFKKSFLPNNNVFYESRYFESGFIHKNRFELKDKQIQILICEDFWQVQKLQSVDLILCMSASPYAQHKATKRLDQAKNLVKKYKCPFVYLNCVGAQTELIFDGGSFVLDKKATLKWQGLFFQPDFTVYDTNKKYVAKKLSLKKEEQQIQAIVLGIKSFCNYLHISKVHIGLSGGIDSALVLYLAVKALGPKNVSTFFLPSPFTQKISYEIVEDLSKHFKVSLKTIDISKFYKAFKSSLFKTKVKNPITLENLQARIRSVILMAEANESKSLLLGTGNKSELATGYSTLYGDLSGALLPIGDLWKTEVYDLVKFINKITPTFSKKLILRPPTAELSFQQTDESQLLPYKKLDALLKALLKHNPPKTAQEKTVARLLSQSEFKRKQSPPILHLSETAFGEGRRVPLLHRFPF